MTIEVFISSAGNVGYVWNVEDVFTLREDHRIVGALIGCLPRAPRQDNFLGVPLVLSPDEIDLLVSEGLVKTLTLPKLCKIPSEDVKVAFSEYREDSYQGQIKVYRKMRKVEILKLSDQIVEGKRKKMMEKKVSAQRNVTTENANQSCLEHSQKSVLQEESGNFNSHNNADQVTETYNEYIENDGGSSTSSNQKTENDISTKNDDEEFRQKILKEELSKIRNIPRHQETVQIFSGHPWIKGVDKIPFEWLPPTDSKDKIRRATFKTLWKRDFYITSGEKFGGDFLAYLGDPCFFHAHFVVICSTQQEFNAMSERDLVCRSRLGTAVKKTVLLASLNPDGSVKFKALKRISHKRKLNDQ